MKTKNLFEVVGRMVILTLITFAVNRTEWYQNLPIQILTNTEPMVWIYCILLILSFLWIGLPIFKFKRSQTKPKALHEKKKMKYCGKCWSEDLGIFFVCAKKSDSDDLEPMQCPTCREEEDTF